MNYFICQRVRVCSAGLSGRIREIEAHSLGSQAQVGPPWPTVMTASRLSAHVNLTLCHLADGGKVQAWSWHTFQNCQSVNAHQEAVTSIQVGGSFTC